MASLPDRDPRLRALRAAFRAGADPEHAAFHREYHKSSLRFHGLRTDALRRAVKGAFPRRPPLQVAEARALCRAMWASGWFEERVAALLLLERAAAALTLRDLPWLRRLAREAEGWGLCDLLSCRVLAPFATARGERAWTALAGWAGDRSLWVRRASVVVHVVPGREGRLCDDTAWRTFEDLLPDRDFFIRKAIGWALRECGKKRPADVRAFLARVGDRASPLTRREGSRKLEGVE